MIIDFEEFKEFCRSKNSPNSGKATSYVNAIKIIFEFLDISEKNVSYIEFNKILQIEKTIHNKNSDGYSELLNFVTKRGQKSYLENYHMSAALTLFKEFYKKLSTSNNPQNQSEVPTMKEDLSNEIYYGVPGTGKTYKMQHEYIDKFSKDDCFVTTFHQSFSYEEFVEGIKAKVNSDTNQVEYKVEPGIFYEACEKAAKLAGFSSIIEMIDDGDRAAKIQDAIDNGKIVCFCIDEINRGNIASIFGELISLIEESKRCGANPKTELVVKLPYSNQRFAVPANLKIIGTMNTADRSIQLLDSALRRRFRFVECQPEYSGYNQKASRILKSMNNRIRALLGKDYQIGHAYFMNISDENEDLEIFECMRDKIIPLLEEYFYGETQKIRMVLNEYGNSLISTDGSFYIEDTEAINSLEDYGDSLQLYKLNENLSSVTAAVQAKSFIDHIEKK